MTGLQIDITVMVFVLLAIGVSIFKRYLSYRLKREELKLEDQRKREEYRILISFCKTLEERDKPYQDLMKKIKQLRGNP